MIRNIYFKAKCCGDTEIRYVDDKFVETVNTEVGYPTAVFIGERFIYF